MPRFPVQDSPLAAQVTTLAGERPELVLTTADGPVGVGELHIVTGESGFERFVLHVRLDLDREPAHGYRFAVDARARGPALYAGGLVAPGPPAPRRG